MKNSKFLEVHGKFSVFDRLIEGVQVINRKWQYIYVNDAVARHGKTTKKELIGHTMMEKYPGIEKTGMFRCLRKCMAKRKPVKMTNEFTYPDGSNGWFELSMQPVPEGALILSSDISKLKKTEAVLAGKLVERNIMLKQIKEQKKRLEEFCFIIAHNMRAPLSNLLLLHEMIKKSNVMDEKLTYLDKQKQALTYLHATFEELVEATLIQTDLSVMRQKINFTGCLEKTTDLLQGEIDASKARITPDFSAADSAFFPGKYLDSIMFNLLSNALKYSHPGRTPEISVRSYVKKGWTYLEITDNGLGIDLKKYSDKIFKLRKTFHDHPKARGFGLFITKTQVQAMGGAISVESDTGRGSVFTVKLCKNQ